MRDRYTKRDTKENNVKKLAAAAVVIVAGLAAPTVASADHNVPAVEVTEGACGEVTLTANWSTDTHTVDNTVLVVRTVNGQDTAPIGESLTVPPIDYASDTIQYRVWGGGERNYDSPALSDLSALVTHIEAGGDPLDISAPGVEWHSIPVEGCVPGPEGPEGPEGPQGSDGPAGEDGRDGTDGSDGSDGADGVDTLNVAAPAVAVTGEPSFTG